MLNSQNLINKICNTISCGGLSNLQNCQTQGALDILSNTTISVTTFTNLPNSQQYKGRMIYVDDEKRYYYSTGLNWINDLSSDVSEYATEIYGWGSECFGLIGNNCGSSYCARTEPVIVVGGFSDWCQISTTCSHSLAIRTNGTAWAWGNNYCGQLGDYTTYCRSSPVSVVGGFTDWCQVSAGTCHSLGVKSDGTAWAWGNNYCGQLGDYTTYCISSPVSIVGGFTDWCQVSAGGCHSLGLKTDGTAWAWGGNYLGQLGDNTGEYGSCKSSPVSVVGGFTDWCQVSAGETHSLGVRLNGSLWSWGDNCFGQLGNDADGFVSRKSSPVSVVGGFTDWCQVSAGLCHSLGVRTNGTAWSWGYNYFGQLGDNTGEYASCKSSPVSVVGGFTDWCQVSAGSCHSLGVRTNGTAWSWGGNYCGQLGDSSITCTSSPVIVSGLYTTWCQVSAGSCHSLAILSKRKGF